MNATRLPTESNQDRLRPRVLWPFVALLAALVLGAAVVLGPGVGSGMKRSVGPLATLGWLTVSVYAVGIVWLVLVRWQRRDPQTVGFHRRTVTVADVVAGIALGVGAVALA